MAKYVQKRPDSSQWQFVLRVPSDLLHRYPSRLMLYGWGIGINDVDNGVFLPASASAKAPELADAVGHDDLHRHAVYYVRVERRLGAVDQSVQAEGRAALRKMRADMLSGAFPVKRG